MKNALLVFEKDNISAELETILSEEYKLFFCKVDEVCGLLKNKEYDFAAVFVLLKDIQKDDYALLKKFSSNYRYSSYPVIAISDKPLSESDTECIDYGISDLITPPYEQKLLHRRIINAIRGKDSMSFKDIEKILKLLPSNIFLKDSEGRYIFSTHYWHHLNNADDPDFNIRGKTDVEIRKDKESAMKALESDKEVVRSGKGTRYILEEHSDNRTEYLELIKEPVFDENGKVTGIISLINDVTDMQVLKKELEKKSTIDQLTEVYNRSATEEHITQILSDQGKKNAYLLIDIDVFKSINDSYGHMAGDAVLQGVARILKESIKGRDVAGRIGGDEFVVFLNDINSREDAGKIAEEIGRRVRETVFYDNPEIKVTLSIGISFSPEHGTDIEDLYRCADEALYYVKKHCKDTYRCYGDE